MAFSRSGKTVRSPTDYSKLFNCQRCKRPDSYEDMVECTKCKKWFHYSCAEVDETVKDKTWECKVCVASTVNETNKSQVKGVKSKTKIVESKSAVSKVNVSVKETPLNQGFGYVQTPTPVESIPPTATLNTSTMAISSTIGGFPSTNVEKKTPILPITTRSAEIPPLNSDNLNFGSQAGIESKTRDDKSIASSKSSQRKKQLALMKLQEEYKLRAQREREFLNEKYTLLENLEENDEANEVDRSSFTEEWVQNQVDNQDATMGEKFEQIDNNFQAISKPNISLDVRNVVTHSNTTTAIPHSEMSEFRNMTSKLRNELLKGPFIDDTLKSNHDSYVKMPVASLPILSSQVLLSCIQSKSNENPSDATICAQDKIVNGNQCSAYEFPTMPITLSLNQTGPSSTNSTSVNNSIHHVYSSSIVTSRPICSAKIGDSVSNHRSSSMDQISHATPLITTSTANNTLNPTQLVPDIFGIAVTSHSVYNQTSNNVWNSQSGIPVSTVPVYTTANAFWSNSSNDQFINSSAVSSFGPMLVNPSSGHNGNQFYSPRMSNAGPALINDTSSHSQFNIPFAPSAGTMFNHTSNQFNPSLAANSGQMFANPTSMQYNTSSYQQAPRNMASNVNILDGNGLQTTTLTREQLAARQVVKKDLPFFYGDPEEWPMFFNRLKRSTEMCGYSNSGRLLHPANVPAIIQTLKTMFGRPELIINVCLTRIEKTPPLKSDDMESLISFAFSVEGLRSMIVECDCPSYLSDRTLLQKLTDKLPYQTKINWAMYKASIPNADLGTLANWLDGIAQAASQIVVPEVRERPHKQDKRQQEDKGSQKNRNYVATHIDVPAESEISTSSESSVKICKVCDKKNHSITECRAFQGYKQKEKWAAVRKFKLCRNCLGSHSWNSCTKKQQCGKDGCTSLHHPFLHSQSQSSEETGVKKNVTKKGDTKSGLVTVETCKNNAHTSKQPVIFRIIPVKLYSGKKMIYTLAYLDEGSSFTLIEEGIAKELGLNGIPGAICLEWTGKIIRTEPDSHIVTVTISGTHGSIGKRDHAKYELHDVRTVPSLNLPAQTISYEAMTKKYPHLENVPFESYQDGQPRILIGLPHAKLTNTIETKEGGWNQPIATKTRLGWVLHGSNGHAVTNQAFVGTHIARKCICMGSDSLYDLVKDYIRSDNLDITPSRISLESKEDRRSKYLMDNFIIRKNGRYEAPLLWRLNDVSLPDNYAMAFKRLICLESKMAKDPELAEKIKSQIEGHIQKNYIRKLRKEELQVKHPNTYYLPIFNAVNPKKPTKTRIVWDAAAKFKGISLNSMLLTGPDQLTLLPDVLRRFREKRIAIGADIVEMFHQIQVRESDQHSQRFLWRTSPEKDPDVYVMRVLTFGATCSPSIAQYVKNKNAENYKRTYPRANEAITKNTYMDDLLDSVHTEAEAVKLLKDVKFINKQAGFDMRAFISNSPYVLKMLGEQVSSESKNLNLDAESAIERILGMFWNPNTDMFTYSLKYLDKKILKSEKHPTKREMLRTLMSIFDPLGFLSFFLINAKIILQETWRTKLDWDDELTGELLNRWLILIKILPEIEKIQIPRLYSPLMSPNEPDEIQIHTFVDGSKSAYSTVIYYRVRKGSEIQCCIVGAKSKVGPIRPLSIPRMELQGAVLGSRYLKSITKSHTLQINRNYLWTDSATVIRWLNSTSRRYHQYVSCRIGEILENTNSRDWRWLPSKENVADLASKWNDNPNFDYNSRWFSGPEFLLKSEEYWPKNIDENESTTEEEIRPHFAIRSKLRDTFRIQPERFSNFYRMRNALAYAYRYMFNLRARIQKQQPRTEELLPEEMSHAAIMLFRQAQFEAYAQEVVILQKLREGSAEKNEVLDKSSHIYNFSPYMDENGLIRMHGRIDAMKGVAESVKRPIILPREHRITFLAVDRYHRNLNHQNQETIVNEIRQQFSIPHLRTLVKSIKSKCRKCKNSQATPQPPEMAPLPEARLSISNPVFTYVGIDYFGPITVSVPIGTRNAKRNGKRWIVLFTCLTTRAIHMEIVEGYDSDLCIMAIRNFKALRGVIPAEYFSDNGTHFTGANNELRAEFLKMDPLVVAQNINSPYSKWNFNPPAAPHMGGVYERLIQSVKNNLEKAMPTRTPTDPMLRNFICEITNIINSRPLTFLPLDSAESEALTPNHFLFGSSNGMKFPCDINPDASYLKRQWKRSQQMIDHFRKRWILEYLPNLTRRTKWFDKVRPIEVGDIVVVMDEKNWRNTWNKGVVVETFKGKGDQVRSANVRVTQSEWKNGIFQTSARIYKRPAAKLALLDIESKESANTFDVGKDVTVKDMQTEEICIPGGSSVGRHIDSYIWKTSTDKNSNLKRLAPPTASVPTSKNRRH